MYFPHILCFTNKYYSCIEFTQKCAKMTKILMYLAKIRRLVLPMISSMSSILPREREHHLFLHSEPGVVLSQNISRGGGDKRATCKSGISCNVCTATARRKWVNVRRFKSCFSLKNHESSRDVPVAILVSCMCSLCQHQLGII